MWAVMKAVEVQINVPGVGPIDACAGVGGPRYYMPLFDTREQAVAFDAGSDRHVREVGIVMRTDTEQGDTP